VSIRDLGRQSTIGARSAPALQLRDALRVPEFAPGEARIPAGFDGARYRILEAVAIWALLACTVPVRGKPACLGGPSRTVRRCAPVRSGACSGGARGHSRRGGPAQPRRAGRVSRSSATSWHLVGRARPGVSGRAAAAGWALRAAADGAVAAELRSSCNRAWNRGLRRGTLRRVPFVHGRADSIVGSRRSPEGCIGPACREPAAAERQPPGSGRVTPCATAGALGVVPVQVSSDPVGAPCWAAAHRRREGRTADVRPPGGPRGYGPWCHRPGGGVEASPSASPVGFRNWTERPGHAGAARIHGGRKPAASARERARREEIAPSLLDRRIFRGSCPPARSVTPGSVGGSGPRGGR
jgi:hypothetical protein